jgi:L-threonylcarbamoyladenylate synthase
MSMRYACGQLAERAAGIEQATAAAHRGELVVLPTDTVYGLGCDAFAPHAVSALLAAKGRGRDMPVPVLVASAQTVTGLAAEMTYELRQLTEAFWPGPLTLVVRQAASLAWDLGEAGGSVALRMPLHPVALELLSAVGPMAVSSANRSGEPAAQTVDDAQAQLGETVAVYLDGGPTAGMVPSTIVDLTGHAPRVLRVGALDIEEIRAVVPQMEVVG